MVNSANSGKIVNAVLSDLVLDFDMYPRLEVSLANIDDLREAIRAGVDLPPITIDKDSRRVVDGFHRIKASLAEKKQVIACIEKVYADDREMFLDAVRLNAGHGKRLSRADRKHCQLRAKRYRCGVNDLADALGISVSLMRAIGQGRTAISPSGIKVAVKPATEHLAGTVLTNEQVKVNAKLSSHTPMFHVEQLQLLIDSGLLPYSDDELRLAIRRLFDSFGSWLARGAVEASSTASLAKEQV